MGSVTWGAPGIKGEPETGGGGRSGAGTEAGVETPEVQGAVWGVVCVRCGVRALWRVCVVVCLPARPRARACTSRACDRAKLVPNRTCHQLDLGVVCTLPLTWSTAYVALARAGLHAHISEVETDSAHAYICLAVGSFREE
jgi:hypothetical protein